MKKLLYIFLLLLTVMADDYTADWSYYRDIIVNTKSTGAGVSGTEYNFPVLIRLTSGNMDFSKADGAGHDIRFERRPTGTHLYYERERYDSTNALAEFWVLTDTVKGNDSTVWLRMYYGNASAGDSSNPTSTFSTGNGFDAVWHFDTNSDATNNYNLEFTNAYDSTGIVGRSRFANNGNMSTATGYLPNDTGTIILWWKMVAEVFGAPDRTWGNFDEFDADIYSFSPYTWAFTCFGSSVIQQTGVAALGTWNHVAYTWYGGSGACTLWTNGAYDHFDTDASDAPVSDTLTWGKAYGASSSSDWLVDEHRISSVVRSSDWIKLCYQNQQATDSLITVGAEQTPSPTYGDVVWNNANSTYIWNDADNWDVDRLPTEYDTVLYNSTSTDSCTWDINFKVCSLAVLSSYSGNIRCGSTVDTFKLGMNLLGTGTFFMETGEISLYAGIDVGASQTIDDGTSDIFLRGGGPRTFISNGEKFYDITIDSAEVTFIDSFSFNDFNIESSNDKKITTNAPGTVRGDFTYNGTGQYDCQGDSLAIGGDYTGYAGTDINYDASTVWYFYGVDIRVNPATGDTMPYIHYGGSPGDSIIFE